MNLLRNDIKQMGAAFSRDGGSTKLTYPFYILEYMINNTNKDNTITSGQLSDVLNKRGMTIDRKTTGYYLSFLYSLGFRIKFDEYKRGEDTYKTNFYFDHELSGGQIKFLTDSVISSKNILSMDAKYIVDKLNKLVAKDDRYYLDNVKKSNIHKEQKKEFFDNVLLLSKAIKNRVQVEFKEGRYIVDDGNVVLSYTDKINTVNPYSLIVYNDNYYLEGNEDGDDEIKYFKIDKLSDVTLTKKQIKKKELIQPYFEDSSDIVTSHPYMLPGKPVEIELEILPSALDNLVSVFGDKFRITKEGPGPFYRVLVKCNEADMYRFALVNGTSVTVLSPPRLRADIQMTVAHMSNKYTTTREDTINIAYRRAEKNKNLILSDIRLDHEERFKLLNNLLKVDLKASEIKDYSFLKNSPNLARLLLEEERVSDYSVFSNNKNLMSVSFINTNINNLDFLKDMNNLQKILIVSRYNVDVSEIYNLKNLRFVRIYIRNYKEIDIEKIKNEKMEVRVKIGSYEDFRRSSDSRSRYMRNIDRLKEY